ncbi:MAG TPA: hypothetical protein VF228_05200, partial [Iamia sp.]
MIRSSSFRALGLALVLTAIALVGCADEETADDALREATAGDCLAAPEELDDDYTVVACDEAA